MILFEFIKKKLQMISNNTSINWLKQETNDPYIMGAWLGNNKYNIEEFINCG